jgi:hypothetical protein
LFYIWKTMGAWLKWSTYPVSLRPQDQSPVPKTKPYIHAWISSCLGAVLWGLTFFP